MSPANVIASGSFLLAFVVGTPAQADQATTVAAQAPGDKLEQTARLNVERVLIKDALAELGSHAGIALVFSPSLLPDRHVTCRCETRTVREALARLLSGTSFRGTDAGDYILIEPVETVRVHESSATAVSRTQARLAAWGGQPNQPMSSSRPAVRRAAPIMRPRQGSITGRVVELQTQEPVAGAQVHVPELEIGTLTREDGRYLLPDVPVGEVAVTAQVIGYAAATQTVTVVEAETVTLDFELREEALALDEIVVTGQAGQARRREVGNAIAQISMGDIAEPIRTTESLLEARVPGVRVTFTDASVGSGARIRLRGNVSATQSNQPLIYVDGVRQAGDAYRAGGNTKSAGPLADINPQDIDRVEVIKGAAAATLYGTEAAAGVIQIFTRRGVDGDPRFTYQTDQSLSWVRPWGSEERPRLNMDPWLRTAYGQTHVLSATGGSERFRYFVSGNLTDLDGPQVDEFEKRYGVRSNLTVNATPSLSFDLTSMFSHHNFETQPSGNALASIFFNVYRAPNNFVGGAWPHDPEFEDQINLLRQRTAETINQRQNLGLTANWAPLESFSTRVTLGYDRMQQDQEVVQPFEYVLEPLGAIEVANWYNQSLTLDLASNYQIGLTGDLRATLSAGGQLIQRETHTLTAEGTGLPGPGEHTVASAAERDVGEAGLRINTGGFFVQQTTDFLDRYFLIAGVRADGSSAFGKDFGIEVYPKVSASYVISEEGFWPEQLGELRLRGAYGFAGRAPGAFDAVRTWDASSFRGQTAFSPDNVGNPELGPERTGELELGFEGAFLNNRLSLDFTYYRQITSNALVNVGQTPSLGFGGGQLENIGKIRNSGIELGANVTVLNRPSLIWDVGTNISTNDSEILDMGGVESYDFVEGQPLPVGRGAKVVNRDEIADPEYELDAFFGPTQPTLIVGLNTSLRLPRGILVTARGEYQGGHWVSDFASRLMAQRTGPGALGCDAVYRHVGSDDYLGPGDDHPNVGQVRALDRARCFSRSRDDVWWMPADFAKLREITIQAPLPFAIPRAESVQITASVRNLFRWTNSEFASHDPESGNNSGLSSLTQGVITDHVPAPAMFTLSARVTF